MRVLFLGQDSDFDQLQNAHFVVNGTNLGLLLRKKHSLCLRILIQN